MTRFGEQISSVSPPQQTIPLPPFWKSTGFTPASLVFDERMRWNLALIASLPGPGIEYIRPHYLLDLVGSDDTLGWNWSLLDSALDILTGFGFKLIFELMGNPGGRFSDFYDPKQLHRWKEFVGTLLDHLEDRYGQHVIDTWYFESWNEPDIGSWWHQWPDPDAFCLYWDACAAAFDCRKHSYRLGGPATCNTASPVFRRFIDHCATESNAVSGAQTVRFDFVSVHEKGALEHVEDLPPDEEAILRAEKKALDILENSGLGDSIPFMNNECDPQTGWEMHHSWRARAFYPAFMVRTLDLHLRALIADRGIDYPILSNDNAFLGGWGQRTLTVLFSDSEKEKDDRFRLILKPAAVVFGLLGLLGDSVDIGDDDGTIRTYRGEDVLVLAYNYVPRDREAVEGSRRFIVGSGREERVATNEENGYVTRVFLVEDGPESSFHIWNSVGAPTIPAADEYRRLAQAARMTSYEDWSTPDAIADPVTLDLGRYGVALVAFVTRRTTPPEQVTGLQIRRILRDSEGDLLLTWEHVPDVLSLKEYEVWIGASAEAPEERLDIDTGMCSAATMYGFRPEDDRYLFVRARNIWGDVGAFSDPRRIEK